MTGTRPRRSRRLWGFVLAALAAVTVSACVSDDTDGGDGGGGEAASSSTDCGTLRMAFPFDMQVPDPAIFYESDGLSVVRSAYEGLLNYAPNTEEPEIVPLLAESYEVNDDGTVYTFELREGVTFHDGTPLTAEAFVASFDRLRGINAGPVVALADVDSYRAVDELTLEITLNQPDGAFLSYLASPWGPAAVSPTAVEENEVDGDFAQEHLATNSAGTGPYQISSFEPGAYQLSRFDDYWGDPEGDYPPACFETVDIRVLPDFTTQQLELENGNLDIMIHGVTKNDLPRFEDAGFEVFRHTGIQFLVMYLNTGEGAFTDPAVRAAIPAAIDRESIVEEVYGDGAQVAQSLFPYGTLPAGAGAPDGELDPSQLTDAVEAGGWQDDEIDLAFTNDDANNQQVANLIAAQLTEAGLRTTTRAVTQPETFEYPTTPGARPDALILPAAPDSAHPFTWADLFFREGGGLSYFSPEVCDEANEMIDEGRRLLDEQEIADYYTEVAEAYAECGAFVPLADISEVVVAREGMTGFEHRFNDPFALRIASLRLET